MYCFIVLILFIPSMYFLYKKYMNFIGLGGILKNDYGDGSYYYRGYFLQQPSEGGLWFLIDDDEIVMWSFYEKDLIKFVDWMEDE